MSTDVFSNISPLDHRYLMSNPKLHSKMAQYLSEGAYVKYELLVESALTRVLSRRGLCPSDVADEVERACNEITAEEVYAEEQITRHNIRALVNCIQRRVSESARPYVHFTATSVDIMDTANALRYRDFTRDVIMPEGLALLQTLIDLARREKRTVQMGRTHGQHAVPITFGFAVAEYIARLGNRLAEIERTANNLRGKMAGAVGAYNASSIFFEDAETFEREVLGELGLLPAEYATQIVMPEYVTDYVHAVVSGFGVLANLADDVRHLQRSEIGELAERFEKGQVGSSTMPHKRNPWNFEHVKSLWKTFMPRMMTVYMDQLSEHQRDLTNSASGRFVTEILAGFVLAMHRLQSVVSKLVVDTARMSANFEASKDNVIAEPLYILLAASGHPDAHEAVRRLSVEASSKQMTVRELVDQKPEFAEFLAGLSEKQKEYLSRPETYIGRSVQKTEVICEIWQKFVDERTCR
ncbi:MAG TPA: lyase family protein [Bacillota bacterium]|nr:lyase family protein [Bacillota bacterium]HPZ54231.1 lyase family protein [Bacillota bacterium]HQD18709.1 lyase family protein [Bacillota bacterium]